MSITHVMVTPVIASISATCVISTHRIRMVQHTFLHKYTRWHACSKSFGAFLKPFRSVADVPWNVPWNVHGTTRKLTEGGRQTRHSARMKNSLVDEDAVEDALKKFKTAKCAFREKACKFPEMEVRSRQAQSRDKRSKSPIYNPIIAYWKTLFFWHQNGARAPLLASSSSYATLPRYTQIPHFSSTTTRRYW